MTLPFEITTLMFYVFSFMVIMSAVMVISARNSVHSVLFLILAFFNAAGLFVLLGAEYIAMTLVIVYVGAVAVLFLFVVMMLDVDYAALRQGFIAHLPVGIAVALILFAELVMAFFSGLLTAKQRVAPANPILSATEITNTHAIGKVLYTDYAYLFQVSGVILLVAMIGAIVLTHRTRSGVLKQSVSRQIARTREESITLVNVKSGEGV